VTGGRPPGHHGLPRSARAVAGPAGEASTGHGTVHQQGNLRRARRPGPSPPDVETTCRAEFLSRIESRRRCAIGAEHSRSAPSHTEALVEQASPMTSGGSSRPRCRSAAGEDDDALLVAERRHPLGRDGSGSVVPGTTSSSAHIAPRPRTSPYRRVRRQLVEATQDISTSAGPISEVQLPHGGDRSRAAAAATGSRRRPPSLPRDRVMISARPVTAARGIPPRCLGRVMRSGPRLRARRRTMPRCGRTPSGSRRR